MRGEDIKYWQGFKKNWQKYEIVKKKITEQIIAKHKNKTSK